jgi:hypothetical protein
MLFREASCETLVIISQGKRKINRLFLTEPFAFFRLKRYHQWNETVHPRLKVEITITEQSKHNVVLLPKTIDFYQIEITRMLETERYEEAIDLLRFLGKCDSGDSRTNEEWVALLAWLESMGSNDAQVEVLEDQEETEADLFRQHLRMKTENDPNYITQLMEMLQPDVAASKQLLALDQLTYLEETPDSPYPITETLIHWLETAVISPWVQFKALQALKIRRFQGKVGILKENTKLVIDVGFVPLELNEYPSGFIMILHKLQQVTEITEPSLSYFAEEIWEQFLAYIYGTTSYDHMQQGDGASIEVWAAALHCLISELMTGQIDEINIQKLYGVTEESKLQMKQAFHALHSFADQFPFALK